MDLRQLATLCAVADHHSFSKAAQALHTVQSNVSAHVARLEAELGTTLVERAGGALTEQGELVVATARRIQAEIDALADDLASADDQVSGSVRLGVIGTTGRWLVPILLPAVAQRHPRVRIVVVDATTTSLVPQLVDARLDMAVVNLPVVHPDIDVEPLFDEDRILVAPESHPLAERDRITIDDLAPHRLLLEPQGTAFRDALDLDAARAGVTLMPLAEVDGMRLLATLAFEGYGPALLPATAAPSTMAGGPWRRVAVADLTPRSVGLVVRRRSRLSSPSRAVREILRQLIVAEGPHHPGVHRPDVAVRSPQRTDIEPGAKRGRERDDHRQSHG